ncbi:MAG: hypothetical protein JWQ71_2803 [Pedosphaera sp.]|nr:hypothetical protein [Pedosphaera sp.]
MKKATKPNSLGRVFECGGSLDKSLGACRKLAAKFFQMKGRFIERLREEVKGHVPDAYFRKAILEAEALASSTGYPWLLLPVLAEEKVGNAQQWVRRQRNI